MQTAIAEGPVQKTRLIYIDIIKILSCFFVLVNHTNSTTFITNRPSVTWYISLIQFFLSKPAVPLFVMASGATLLAREHTIGQVFRRVGRIVVVILVFASVYFWLGREAPTLDAYLRFLPWQALHPVTNAFWYLYLYIGLLLMLPIARRLAVSLPQKTFLYLLCLVLVLRGGRDIFSHYIPQLRLNGNAYLPLFHASFVLFLAGWFFSEKDFVRNKRRALLCLLLFGAVLLFEVVATHREYRLGVERYYELLDDRWNLPISLMALLIFALFRYGVPRINIPPRAARIVQHVSQCTFGIYLLSDLFLSLFAPVRQAMDFMQPLISTFLYQILIFLVGLAVTTVLRKIPYVSKFI